MALSLALCAVVYAPIAAVQWPSVMPSTDALAAIAILAVVCTAAAFLLFAALIGEIGPVRATVITYINPAVAALLGVVVLRETFGPMAIGFGLVIIGSTLATRTSRLDTRQRARPATGARTRCRTRRRAGTLAQGVPVPRRIRKPAHPGLRRVAPEPRAASAGGPGRWLPRASVLRRPSGRHGRASNGPCRRGPPESPIALIQAA